MIKCESWIEKTKPNALHMSKGVNMFRMTTDLFSLSTPRLISLQSEHVSLGGNSRGFANNLFSHM